MRRDSEVKRALAFAEKLIENTLGGLLAFDPEYRLILWSPTMEQMSGFSAQEILGQDVFSVFPFFKEIGEDDCLKAALNGQSIASRDRMYMIPETRKRGYFDAHYMPLLLEDGVVAGGLGIIRDTTAQKLANERLSETESRFRRMADCSPVLLWMSGRDSLCNFFNQTWLDFTGRTMEQEAGVGWAEGIHPEDFQRCMDTYVSAFKKREPFEMEYRLKRRDGEYRWILDRAVPRYTPEGEFMGYIGSCADLTERKLIEEDLRCAVKARDDFLSIASHELKTPLTSLQLQLDLFRHAFGGKRSVVEYGEVEKVVSMSEKQVRKLSELVQNLLDVSRISAGRLMLHPQEVDLVELSQEVIARFSAQSAQAGCKIHLDEVRHPIRGYWDPTRLDQVLVNLLTNAVKYGARKPVTVTLSESSDYAWISVKDHGIGIEANQIPKIFERFARAVSEEHFGGLGLGLYITKQIVEAHQGTIRVQSHLGEGSEFTVGLPREAF